MSETFVRVRVNSSPGRLVVSRARYDERDSVYVGVSSDVGSILVSCLLSPARARKIGRTLLARANEIEAGYRQAEGSQP